MICWVEFFLIFVSVNKVKKIAPVYLVQILVMVTLVINTQSVIASKYSPPGLYDVEKITLDNGMDVILKPRSGAHTFSIRLWVGVGSQDFSCAQQETPHFLEHLLFTGTSKYSEAELEHLIADHGGYWNAATGVEDTTYDLDIYSQHAEFAVDMLYEILTDSSITPENVEISRDIIHRESGGEPSDIKRWFRDQGFGINATVKAVLKLVPGTNFVCEQFVTATDITREDIIRTFERYYVPGNMALIIVGDFDKEKIIKQLRKTFGSQPVKKSPERIEPKADETTDYDSVTGTFSPLLSDEANIGVMYRLPSYWSDDIFPMMIVEEYLHYKISEIIRIERGLAYAPGTWSYSTGQFGLFGVYADVDLNDIDDTLTLIKEEMKKLSEHTMDNAALEKARLKILLRSVQGYESNSDIADYYVSKYVLFRKNRYFENIEEKIEAVSLDDINRVIDKYLTEDKSVTIYETPTLNYNEFYILLTVILLIALVVVMLFYIRFRARYIK